MDHFLRHFIQQRTAESARIGSLPPRLKSVTAVRGKIGVQQTLGCNLSFFWWQPAHGRNFPRILGMAA